MIGIGAQSTLLTERLSDSDRTLRMGKTLQLRVYNWAPTQA
jgi:hypothetical protein